MKTLSDGTEVPSRTYYYLLDFNEANKWRYMFDNFSKSRLCDLTAPEYWKLFGYAAGFDTPIEHS